MANKRTKKIILNEILEVEGVKNNVEFTETIQKLIEQIDKKNAYKGETVTQKENAKIIEIIKETLAKMNEKARISDIQDANENLANLSNQKMSALLKKLVDTGIVIKTIDKKLAYFEIAE